MTNDGERQPVIRVELVHAMPEQYQSLRLLLGEGATVADALAAASTRGFLSGVEVDPSRLAVFSRLVELSSLVRDGDRIEILRPLLADPKQARRSRAEGAARRKR